MKVLHLYWFLNSSYQSSNYRDSLSKLHKQKTILKRVQKSGHRENDLTMRLLIMTMVKDKTHKVMVNITKQRLHKEWIVIMMADQTSHT